MILILNGPSPALNMRIARSTKSTDSWVSIVANERVPNEACLIASQGPGEDRSNGIAAEQESQQVMMNELRQAEKCEFSRFHLCNDP